MAGAELAPKLEIHKEGEGDVLKTFGDKSQEFQKQYNEVQQAYAQLRVKLNKLQERRWGGVRGPELDENAAQAVKIALEKRLKTMAEEFRAKVDQYNSANSEDLRVASVDVAMSNVKSTLNSLLASELKKLAEDDAAQNPQSMAERLAQRGMDAVRGKTRDERIAEAQK